MDIDPTIALILTALIIALVVAWLYFEYNRDYVKIKKEPIRQPVSPPKKDLPDNFSDDIQKPVADVQISLPDGVNVVNVITQRTLVQPTNCGCLGEGAKVVDWVTLVLVGLFMFYAMCA